MCSSGYVKYSFAAIHFSNVIRIMRTSEVKLLSASRRILKWKWSSLCIYGALIWMRY